MPVTSGAPSPASLLALALCGIFATGAQAMNGAYEPSAKCPSTMLEADYLRSGGKLRVVSFPDLKSFPSGFLGKDCRGNVAIRAVVLPDGAIALAAKDHGVDCVPDSAKLEASFQSIAWHDQVILSRFLSLRFAPPRLGEKPVCVTIKRGWVPEAPHRFFSPEEWLKWYKHA